MKATLKKLMPAWLRRRQASRRGRKFEKRMPEVVRLLADRAQALTIHSRLGIGNVGVVYEAALAPGWEEAFGIIWRGQAPIGERVALKIAGPPNPRERAKAIIPFAEKIAEACASTPPLPLCPWLAIGVVGEGDTAFVVQIMPIIEGKGLGRVLDDAGRTLHLGPTMQQYAAILETVLFFEECGYYTRNLDADNVIVEPDGRWVRIDFDNAEPRTDFPFKRMDRLVRLGLRIVDALEPGASDDLNILRKRLEATAGEFPRTPAPNDCDPAMILRTPGELLECVRRVAE